MEARLDCKFGKESDHKSISIDIELHISGIQEIKIAITINYNCTLSFKAKYLFLWYTDSLMVHIQQHFPCILTYYL